MVKELHKICAGLVRTMGFTELSDKGTFSLGKWNIWLFSTRHQGAVVLVHEELVAILAVCVGVHTCTCMCARTTCNVHMGQCPAKSGLWGYNFITIKIARCTKQHIFAKVLRFPFKFCTIVPTPFRENRFL